jgi:hypothetical protein
VAAIGCRTDEVYCQSSNRRSRTNRCWLINRPQHDRALVLQKREARAKVPPKTLQSGIFVFYLGADAADALEDLRGSEKQKPDHRPGFFRLK